VAVRVVALLAVTVAVTGCGSTVAYNRADGTRTTSPAEVIKRRLEAASATEFTYLKSAPGPMLAKVGLSGGDAVEILAIGCGPDRANGCYRLAKYWEEPARYAHATHGQKRRMVKTSRAPGQRSTILDQRNVWCWICPFRMSVLGRVLIEIRMRLRMGYYAA
jgi:hypothetical protein